MKKFLIFGAAATTAIDSSGYITRDAVKRANALLMGQTVSTNQAPVSDGYSQYRIERPTARQITEAASQAMRNARLEKSI